MIISKLKEIEKQSILRKIPIIGSKKGAWLYEQVIKIKPKKILELGTANGYSGIILGSMGGELTTIEINKKMAKEAEINFKKFKINSKIIVGDGEKEIKKINDHFDIIFIDFAKKKYLKILNECIKLGEYIISDNINFEGCKDFKSEILKNRKLKTKLIKIGDGLSFSKVIN